MTGEPPTLFDIPGANGGLSMLSPDDAPAVLAYRVGQMEHIVREGFKELNGKFDGIAQHYVTVPTLMLTLDPLKERLKELEDDKKEHEKKKSQEAGQFRLAITMAILSPVFTIVVGLLVFGRPEVNG